MNKKYTQQKVYTVQTTDVEISAAMGQNPQGTV